MKKIILFAVLVMLWGCSTHATLVSQDRQRYEVQIDQTAKKMTTIIDGVLYTGTAVRDQGVDIGPAQSSVQLPIDVTGALSKADSNGHALFVARSGDTIECALNIDGATILGNCQSNKGRQFVLTND